MDYEPVINSTRHISWVTKSQVFIIGTLTNVDIRTRNIYNTTMFKSKKSSA